MHIKLSNDIIAKAKNNKLKAYELIEYVLNNVEGTSTNKGILEASLKDICFTSEGNKKPTKGKFDFWTNTLMLWGFVD